MFVFPEDALPFISLLLHLSGNQPQLNILEQHVLSILLKHNPVVLRDRVIADSSGHDEAKVSMRKLTNREITAELEYAGSYRSNPLWKLSIYPYHFDYATNQLSFLDKMILEISTSAAEQNLSPIPETEQKTLSAMSFFSAAKTKKAQAGTSLQKPSVINANKWKILVSKDGIYRVSGTMLEKAGVKLMNVDIQTLRLVHDNREIPICVGGWQNGRFEKQDFFEFWGEERKNTWTPSKDLYQNPYGHTSVYWLSWGEKAGAWMTEEDGLASTIGSERQIRPYSFI